MRRAAALALAVGALAPMAGVLADPLGTVPGTERSDVFKHVWSYWHATAALAGWPWTPYLNAPGGGVLMDLLLVPAVILAPITALLGPGLAANLWIWLNLWATGGATYALARRVSVGTVGALVGGLAAQTAPYLLGYPLVSGVHERLAVWVFPLLATALLAARGAEGGRWVAFAAGGVLVAGVGCQAYVLYGAVMLLLGLPLWVRGRGEVRRAVLFAGAIGAAAVVTWIYTRALTTHAWALVPRPGMTDAAFGTAGRGEIALSTATLATLFDPVAVAATAPRLSGDELYETVYLGWVVIVGALAGAWLAGRGGVGTRIPGAEAGREGLDVRAVRGLALLGAVLALLALGPWVRVGDRLFLEPLHVSISWVTPFYGRYPPTWQQVAAFSPLVAPALGVLVERAGRPLVAGAALLGAILVERALVLPFPLVAPTVALEAPAAYGAVGDDGALVDIPRVVGRTPQASGRVFLGQMTHARPITATINPGAGAWDGWAPVLRGVAADWSAAARCLRAGGVRWVALHPGWFDDEGLARQAREGLVAAVGAPVAEGEVVLFDLGAASTPKTPMPPTSTQPQDLFREGLVGGPAEALRSRASGSTCPAGAWGGGPHRPPATPPPERGAAPAAAAGPTGVPGPGGGEPPGPGAPLGPAGGPTQPLRGAPPGAAAPANSRP